MSPKNCSYCIESKRCLNARNICMIYLCISYFVSGHSRGFDFLKQIYLFLFTISVFILLLISCHYCCTPIHIFIHFLCFTVRGDFFFRASFHWLSSIIIVQGHYKCMYFFFCFVETTKCFILATFVYSFALTPSVSISVVMYSFKRQWCFDLKGGCTQAWNSVHADPDWHCKFDGQWICGQKPSSSTGVGNLFCQEGHFTWSQHSRG